MLARPLYRARQFAQALRPRVDGDRLGEAQALLGPRLSELFLSMSPRDQQHCLAVYGKLLATGWTDGEMLAAALLHDCGKGALAGGPVRLRYRVAYVVVDALAPTFLRRLARCSAGLAVLAEHAERGAELAAKYGATPQSVRLMLAMEAPEAGDERACALRSADDAC